MYQEKIKEYKARQQEIISQMSRHVKADETFHLTANMVLHLQDVQEKFLRVLKWKKNDSFSILYFRT